MKKIVWKAKSGKGEVTFHHDKLIIGLLKTNRLKGTGYGELRGQMLRFEPNGLRKGISVLDIEGEKEVGHITIEKAEHLISITLRDEKFTVERKGENWHISDETEEVGVIHFDAGQLAAGTVSFDYLPYDALLVSFYAANLPLLNAYYVSTHFLKV